VLTNCESPGPNGTKDVERDKAKALLKKMDLARNLSAAPEASFFTRHHEAEEPGNRWQHGEIAAPDRILAARRWPWSSRSLRDVPHRKEISLAK